MKSLFISLVTFAISFPALAAPLSYMCQGSSNNGNRFSTKSVTVTESETTLGVLDGFTVSILAVSDKIFLMLKSGDNLKQARGAAGGLVEYSERNTNSLIVASCHPLI